MASYGFRVYGIVASQGSKIPGRSSTTGKLFVREQGGKKLDQWRSDVKEAAQVARGDADTFAGAIDLRIDFYVNRPASVSAKKRPHPTVRPDLDKMVRGVCDALKAAGVYKDDSQVVRIVAAKRYAAESVDQSPGAWIVVSEINML